MTPEENITDPAAWFKNIVQTELRPLLKEYWFDATDKAEKAVKDLLDGL